MNPTSSSGSATTCACPTIPRCTKRQERRGGDRPLCPRRDSTSPGPRDARRARSAARRAGGSRSRCDDCRRAWLQSAARWCCDAGPPCKAVTRACARDPARVRCSGTRSPRCRSSPVPTRSRRRCAPTASRSGKFPGDLLVDPAILRSKDGRALRVFTPFWRRVLAIGAPPKLLPAPTMLPSIARHPERDRRETLTSSPPNPIGPRACARPGTSASAPRGSG